MLGNIVLDLPLASTACTSLWQDEEYYYHSYLKRFDGQWFETRYAGIIDKDGYLHVIGRTDDL